MGALTLYALTVDGATVTGPANSLVIGTVTTGAAGSSASASITGTAPEQTLDLTIPRGETGNPTAHELRGTGMPNGVVTASPGTYYTDTAGTNGAWRWLKKFGTGNTGWDVVHGNTGWRDVTSHINSVNFPPETISGQLYIRRVNNLVEISFRSLKTSVNVATGPGRRFLVAPDGFLPEIECGVSGYSVASNNSKSRHVFQNEVGINRRHIGLLGRLTNGTWTDTWDSVHPLVGEIFYRTEAEWPTTMPGTPA